MNVRHCVNPEKIFDVFTTLSYSPTDVKETRVESKIPSHFDNEDILKQIPRFAYPCAYDSNVVEHYTFVLTDVEAKFHYGFCRLSPDQHQIICLISRLPWFDVFYKLLNKISEITGGGDTGLLQLLLEAVYNTKVPAPNEPCTILPGSPLSFTLVGPELDKLACIPENRNLTEYYSAIDPELMINMYASMLMERRIIITSSKLSKLTACCHGAAALLHPCYWQHLFIPVLPAAVIEMVTAPMPYIIGVHSSLMAEARRNELDDAIVLNVDDGTMEDIHNDRSLLPSEAVSALKRGLKPKPPQAVDVSRVFLRCLVQVIGGYRDGLKYHEDGGIEFNEDVYMAAGNSSGEKAWREIVCRQQYFSTFVDDRIAALAETISTESTGTTNSQGYYDEFDTEMVHYSSRSGANQKYKDLVSNLKKKGKNMKSKGQHTIVDLSKKTQDRAKHMYKFLKTKLDEAKAKDYSIIEKGGSTQYIMKDSSKVSGQRDITSPPPRPTRGPTVRASSKRLTTIGENQMNNNLQVYVQPPRPGSNNSNDQKFSELSPRRKSYETALKYKPLSLTDDDLPTPGTTDLMNDPDLQSFLTKSHSIANLQTVSEHSPTSSNNSPASSSLTLNAPIAPPRRKKLSNQKPPQPASPLINHSTGLHNGGGFTDNFSDMDFSFNSSSFDTTDSKPAAGAAPDNLLSMDSEHFSASPRASNPVESREAKTSSYLSDLDGLELSPSKTINSTPSMTPNGAVNWNQSSNKPNYNISTAALVVGRVGTPSANTNPFRDLGYNPNSMSAPGNLSMMQQVSPRSSVQVSHRPSPARPPAPQLIPKPINPVTTKPADPLADLKWGGT